MAMSAARHVHQMLGVDSAKNVLAGVRMVIECVFMGHRSMLTWNAHGVQTQCITSLQQGASQARNATQARAVHGCLLRIA